MNWKRILHHRYTGTMAAFGFLGWFTVQMARHESVLIPLIGAITSLIWVLDDVLCEELGWKTPGYRADHWLMRFPVYNNVKAWIEKYIGGNKGET